MKARVRKRSDYDRVESVQHNNTLSMQPANRSAARQECIGHMEEELHRAFAVAR